MQMGGRPILLHGKFERGENMYIDRYGREKNYEEEKLMGRCRFKGGSSTTVNNSYTPSQYELELQKQEADYSKAVAPNALSLNNTAMNLLKDSLGTVQVDYNGMNNKAQNQIANATSNTSNLANSNNAATNATNGQLSNVISQYGNLANNTRSELSGMKSVYSNSAAAANNTLGNIGNNAANATSSANNDISTAGGTLGGLANGQLPNAYQSAMENSISSALNNTIGNAVNSLGNRGVLNSSVTSSALNDIQKNAADSVAQQYNNNISNVANLTNQQANLSQQQLANTQSQANTAQNIAQQQYSNTNNANNSIANLINQNYNIGNSTLGQQASLMQQQLSNTQNNNSQNSGLYSNLINSATNPITTAAAAQEAAQTPAGNLWNYSLGLNGATTGALAAAAGKGTSTQTATSSGSGGLFGNLLGGFIGGAASGYGSSLVNNCFPSGTKVTMADGSVANIEDVKVGDKVMNSDGESGTVVKVMDPHDNDVYDVVADNGHTRCTASQPLMNVDGEYIDLDKIAIETELKNVGSVRSIEYSGKEKVYDIQVEGNNSYIADGFVAQGGSSDVWGCE